MRYFVWVFLFFVQIQFSSVSAVRCQRYCSQEYKAGRLSRSLSRSCKSKCVSSLPSQQACITGVNSFYSSEVMKCRQGTYDNITSVSVLAPPNNTYLTTFSHYVYEKSRKCIRAAARRRRHAIDTCVETICPGGQYFVTNTTGCTSGDTGGGPGCCGFASTPTNNNPVPLPQTIRGFFKWSWKASDPYQGPEDTNMGVTFTGRFPGDPDGGDIAPLTTAPIKIMSYGGGNQNGAWSAAKLSSIYSTSNINFLNTNGYNGVLFDVEEYATGTTNIDTSAWNAAFQSLKSNGFIVIVCISHFSPYGMANGDVLVDDWITNSNIDVFSPQLYTTGNEQANDWSGFDPKFTNIVPRMAPSINQESFYDSVAITVKSKLPNSSGYFVWDNEVSPGPGPGPTPTCVSGYFPGSGCSYMCSWCQQQLGTDQYYWTDNVCTYDASINDCNGNPLYGVEYTCCKAGTSLSHVYPNR